MTVLDRTFGTDLTCIKRFLTTFASRPHLIEVHLLNNPCRRFNRCEAHDFHPELTVAELNRQLAAGNPVLIEELRQRLHVISTELMPHFTANTTPVLSLELESRLKTNAYAVLYFALRDQGPWLIAASNVRYVRLGIADLWETHNLKRGGTPPCIANEDGAFRQDLRRSYAFLNRHRRCLAVFFWRPETQGVSHLEKWLPVSVRQFSIPPETMAEISHLLALP